MAMAWNNMGKKIVVIIPSYNNSHWYTRNLASVFAQDYNEELRVIYIDDGSSDGTGEMVQEYLAERNSGSGPSITFLHNSVRTGALQNLYNAIRGCADDEVVILLDGDDWLAHNGVLKAINEVYTDTDCWMTYGQYRSWPDNAIGLSKEMPSAVIEANGFRKHEWCSSHLRSFYAWLFKLINKNDLLAPDGTFYQMAWDQAIMFPLLEMSGHRATFINEVLYIYNNANPISDCKIDRELQRQLEMDIRGRTRYRRIDQ
jgi:glycosyltransferase involved in cell wall biosynthesis